MAFTRIIKGAACNALEQSTSVGSVAYILRELKLSNQPALPTAGAAAVGGAIFGAVDGNFPHILTCLIMGFLFSSDMNRKSDGPGKWFLHYFTACILENLLTNALGYGALYATGCETGYLPSVLLDSAIGTIPMNVVRLIVALDKGAPAEKEEPKASAVRLG